MATEGINLFEIGNDDSNQALLAALQKLRADFDAHNHDGVNSKSFDNITARSLLSSGQLVAGSIYVPSINSPKFSVDKNGKAKVSSLERNDIHWFSVFEGVPAAFGTQGTVVINQTGVSLTTGAVSGNEAELQKVAVYFSDEFSWARDRKFKTVIKFTNATDQTCYIVTGPGQSASNIARHFGFKIVDGTIYGSCADGTTQSLTTSLGNFSAGSTRTLEARFVSGSVVDFYINGVKAGSLSTNLPSGTTSANFLMDLWVETNAAAAKTIEASYWDIWQASA